MNKRLLTCALMLAALPVALAQNIAPPSDGAGSPPPPAGQRPQGPGGHEGHEGPMGSGGPGMHILPPGMWWKSPEIVTALSLSTEQQKRIDDLFLKSRVDLIHAHAALQENELLLEPILNAATFDQAKAQAQIDKIADTRAMLEKTDAHMLLSIRAVLTPDQWTKLQAQRGPGRHEMDHGRGGPGMSPGGHQHSLQTPPPPPPPPSDDDNLLQ